MAILIAFLLFMGIITSEDQYDPELHDKYKSEIIITDDLGIWRQLVRDNILIDSWCTSAPNPSTGFLTLQAFQTWNDTKEYDLLVFCAV